MYSSVPEADPVIWLHAVSVGEVEAAVPLIRNLKLRFPEHHLVISTVTPTGASTVKQRFGEELTHYYLPYDLPFAVETFLKQVKPVVAIIMETEIWPNLYHYSKTFKIPVFIANARISDNSFRGYRRIKSLTKQSLGCVTRVFAQTELDQERFRELGCEQNQVIVAGNLKYDLPVDTSLLEEASELKSRYYHERRTWIAASTHEKEEEIILRVHGKLLSKHPDCLLILAPRHPQRFERVYKLCAEEGFQVVRRSEGAEIMDNKNVLVIDSLGVLQLYYALSDIAFVGGSLVAAGGHNMLEAVNMGTVVLTGPHTDNFREITKELESADALCKVNEEEQLEQTLLELFDSPERRKKMQERGREIINKNQGSTQRTAEIISDYVH